MNMPSERATEPEFPPLTEAQLRRSIYVAAILALLLPPFIGGSLMGVVGFYPMPQFYLVFFSYSGAYVAAVMLAVLSQVPRACRFIVGLTQLEHAEAEARAQRVFARVPWYLLGSVTLYSIFGALSADLSLEHMGYAQYTLRDHLFHQFGLIPVVLITVFPIFFFFVDRLGRYLAPRGLSVTAVPLWVKLLMLGIVTPLLIDSLLIGYYYNRTGYFQLETGVLWFSLLALAAGGTWLAWRSLRQGAAPLVAFIASSPNSLAEHIRDGLTPLSLDELGELTARIGQLLGTIVENNHRLTAEVAQRKEAEGERDRLASILEATTDIVSMADPQGNILYFNQAGRSMLGKEANTEMGAVIAEVHPLWAADLIFKEGVPTAIREGAWLGETAILGPDGREIPVSQVILSHKDDLGNLLYLSTIMRDISERQDVQRRLEARDQLLRRLSERVPGVIYQYRLYADGRACFPYASEGIRDIYGVAPEEVRDDATPVFARLHPEDVNAVAQSIQRSSADLTPWRHEYRVLLPERGERWLRGESVPERLDDGSVLWHGYIADVTDFKRAEAALQRLNDELEDRVEQRTRELIAAKVEAERASLAKSDFLSRMSHELRTPMNAILGFSQLLESDPQHPLAEIQSDSVQEILHAGGHLLDLINEVLDLARIESGKFTVSQEPVPLIPLISDCLTLIRPQAEARGIRIVEAGRDCGEHVLADRVRLKQVLLNLLSNAVKYNRAQGTLSVVCMPQGDAIQIRISDSGAGLSAEQQARLFVAFERLDADKTAVEGTGIGLALSKRLTELMHGEIGVESTPGSGSTFWVRLPIAEGHSEDSHHPGDATSEDQVGRPGSHMQWDILCIEDNPANLRLIERILARRSDIRLLTASAPGLGLELAVAHRPALILLDINLPDMDGYAVMQCLRESPVTRDIPVVAISANAMPKDLARGKAAGFVDYLTKPLEVAQLLAVLDKVLVDRPASSATND